MNSQGVLSILLPLCAAVLCCVNANFVSAEPLTLEQIMAHPDWLGNSPERPYWADDGKSVYYQQKRQGEEARDLVQVDLNGKVLRVVADKDRGTVDVAGGVYSRDRRSKVYAREGDIYLKNVRTGQITQLTRTQEKESDPRFLAAQSKISFSRGETIFVRDMGTGLEYEPAGLRLEDDPDDEDKDEGFLDAQQERLFEIVRSTKEKRDAARERAHAQQAADTTRVRLPWYLGKDYELVNAYLSPHEDYVLAVVRSTKKTERGKSGTMPNYVTESGYTTTRDTRSRVGTGSTATDEILLLDLATHEKHAIDLSVLPKISEDPLKELREAAEAAREDQDKTEDESVDEDEDEDEEEKPAKPRAVAVRTVEWSPDGTRLVVQLRSRDNKDRWVAEIVTSSHELRPLFHESDEAWIVWRGLTALEWLHDSESFFFTSEEAGYNHLYLMSIEDGSVRTLTSGDYEVSQPVLSSDGKDIYFRANMDHPGVYEAYRVGVASRNIEQLTRLGGNNRFVLAPKDKHLLVSHSTSTRPYEIFVQQSKSGAKATPLTQAVSDAFTEIDWVTPRVVAVPSSHMDRPVYARVYSDGNTSGAARPAVVFIHGAGYLQNAHTGWSSYSREFMFHSLLVQHGYVVLDMDYRASAGYGRDWRTAIYRNMGTPEVEDLEDGVAWLVENENVDSARVGCYGGSYGGFLTLMSLFNKPDLFACGAALRPVTDWAHYNHGYTSNILNVPLTDPEAYGLSSPIEFAEGLTKPLLICHGMQDDNVFFQDSVRLVQRLIELKKENWELAVYPIERHGFREPSSWLDEYRRIFNLFEQHLK